MIDPLEDDDYDYYYYYYYYYYYDYDYSIPEHVLHHIYIRK